MAEIKAVIFDMDGVITDTEKLLVKYWCQAAGDMGFSMTREHALQLRSLASRYAEPYLKELFGEDFNYRKVRALRKEMMDDHIDVYGIGIKPGLEELISYLGEHGYKIAVATATDYDRAVPYLQKAGVYDSLDALCCGPSVEHGKPEPDIYLYAAQKLGVQPEECLAVEDSPNGVKAAYRANMHTVMIPDLTQPDEKLKKMIYRKCDDLLEVIGVLELFQCTFF